MSMRWGVAGALSKAISVSTSSTTVRSNANRISIRRWIRVVSMARAWPRDGTFKMGSRTSYCLFRRLALLFARLQSIIVTVTCDAVNAALTRTPAGWLLQLGDWLNVATLTAQPARWARCRLFRLRSGCFTPAGGAPYIRHDSFCKRFPNLLLRVVSVVERR